MCFKRKVLFCLCNPYAGVASARVTHQTRVLQVRLRHPNQAPEIQVLRFTNVVWLHYRAALVHKIFGVYVNVINNIMRTGIDCLLMIGSVLSNDFPLILLIIGNVLGLPGEGMEIEASPLQGYRRVGRYPIAVTWAAHRALCS